LLQIKTPYFYQKVLWN